MDDLVQWLRAQLDADEQIARAADGELSAVFTRIGSFDPEMADDERHIMTHQPARVLREIDAKRQVIDSYAVAVERVADRSAELDRLKARRYDTLMTEMDLTTAIHQRDTLGGVLRLLALPYADRPGFREEWRP
ncbi:DUF6221 family protein [Streptomyces sp. BPPL-273]|uniref:DUF6221 family protein n=1 Tax=Streptomyces sp. BPPL-273 TaxID=2987533 RepID=UPI0024AE8DB4|nr:DUF6221 family protein [Streptomyces sp. BPPL-273]WHM30230.1 DUF6221 family protein [Streptomyces sp. BPPL-273]